MVPTADERPLVLVAEDHDDARELYAAVLEDAGFEAVKASDGTQALALVRDRPPAILILDLSIPVVDGFEVARLVREDPATRPTRILVVTGHSERAVLDRATELDVDGVLLKPVDAGEVVRRVRALLARS